MGTASRRKAVPHVRHCPVDHLPTLGGGDQPSTSRGGPGPPLAPGLPCTCRRPTGMETADSPRSSTRGRYLRNIANLPIVAALLPEEAATGNKAQRRHPRNFEGDPAVSHVIHCLRVGCPGGEHTGTFRRDSRESRPRQSGPPTHVSRCSEPRSIRGVTGPQRRSGTAADPGTTLHLPPVHRQESRRPPAELDRWPISSEHRKPPGSCAS